jgi:sterol desaturase/sphingolipid hydroxylase (fatty acid hydroxylase superfamily)
MAFAWKARLPGYDRMMDVSLSEAALEQWLTGLASFALYWAILLGVAGLEVFQPGRTDRMPVGPRFTVNFGFGLMTMALLTLPVLSEVTLAQMARSNGWGLFHRLSLGPVWAIGLSFLAYDLCGYTIHRLSHRWPWLWRLHRVHHSDSDMDLSTYFRSHPADVMAILAIKYVLIVALGLHPAALALHGLGKQLTMSFGHANIRPRPRLSRIVSLLFVSPAFHQIHHSAWRPETDSNYGEVLTIWDRLFGSTGRVLGTVERYGLGDAYDADSASLAAQLKLPFVAR